MKHVQHTYWTLPPEGALKLNFDRSYIKEVSRGGFGRVVRYSSGHILYSYSGAVDCKDSNRQRFTHR